jgi:hypothetical protein
MLLAVVLLSVAQLLLLVARQWPWAVLPWVEQA